MLVLEISYGAARPIDGYGPGFFRIDHQVLRGPVLVTASGVGPWAGLGDSAAPLALAGRVDVLLVGMGDAAEPLPGAFRAALEAAGIGVEAMATPAACRTYNVLLAEDRRIAAALLPVTA